MKDKEPVRLRAKTISESKKSLYLDIYVNGVRHYEFLRLYLLPDTSRSNKEKNRQTMQLANAVKSKRLVEIQNGRFGFMQDNNASKVRLFDYFQRMIEERKMKDSKGNARNWEGCLLHLHKFERRTTITLAEISPKWLANFQTYLTTARHDKTHERLRNNTILSYYKKVVAMLNKAVKDGILTRNPAHSAEPMKGEDTERMYLTIEEVRTLFAHREGKHKDVKDVFLFSCLTGLRKSDIAKLTWAEVEDNENGTILRFRQKKTKGLEHLYITHEARVLMGERRTDKEKVFTFRVNYYINVILANWMQECDINKHITFHCARHTFATMMLTLGTDLYTTSKLLGHRNVKTTQIYARIIDEKKKEAVDNIPDFGI